MPKEDTREMNRVGFGDPLNVKTSFLEANVFADSVKVEAPFHILRSKLG